MTAPYISVVIVGRNDNYGVNFIQRMNTFIRSLDRQVAPHVNLIELIIVEWNPLPDSEPLHSVIEQSKNYTTRVITVPPELHNTVPDVKSPVLEFWGKNVGIRRARGEYVLVSNPDILFSDQMIDFLATRKLESHVVYRTDRFDYHGEGIENLEPDEYIKFAMKNVFQVHACPDTIPVQPTENFKDMHRSAGHVVFTNASGDFILSAKKNFEKSHGLCFENPTSLGHVDSFSLIRLLIAGEIKNQITMSSPMCIFHMDHPRKPNTIPWQPDVATASAQWAGWLARPSWFDSNWGFAKEDLKEWSNK